MERNVALLLAACLVLGALGCQPIEPEVRGEPDLELVAAPFTDGIPADYGRFVSAMSGVQDGVAVLWFERNDGSIVVVSMNRRTRTIDPHVTVIPRR